MRIKYPCIIDCSRFVEDDKGDGFPFFMPDAPEKEKWDCINLFKMIDGLSLTNTENLPRLFAMLLPPTLYPTNVRAVKIRSTNPIDVLIVEFHHVQDKKFCFYVRVYFEDIIARIIISDL